MGNIAQDISDFAKLRQNGCIYVDKTAILHELMCDPGRSLYFISRPRRFGKSLMLSTLECIFRGRRDLFKGLAIDKLDYDWAEYPRPRSPITPRLPQMTTSLVPLRPLHESTTSPWSS